MCSHVPARPWQGHRPSTLNKKKRGNKTFLLRSRHSVCFDRFHVNDLSWFVLYVFCATIHGVVIIIYDVVV